MERIVYFENRPAQKSGSPVTNDKRKVLAKKMDGPLSGYWVKFFKNAGFSSEVATKHAVVFSNNRIQPDMLPDLDKPSLKEMGITLMGDMIAILRYAKNVVEENSCKKILVSTEDPPSAVSKVVAKPIVKKIVAKAPVKSAASTKVKLQAPVKVIKTVASSAVKPTVVVKKKIPSVSQTSRMYSDYIESNQRPKTVVALKRKYDSDEDDDDEEEEGIDGKWVHNEVSKHMKTSSNNVEYKVVIPKPTVVRSQKIIKKDVEQNKTVFHRLGDSMVSSTTNITESPKTVSPIFNVTGLGKKRTSNNSVFNRLGNKDVITDEIRVNRNIRNGNTSTSSQGILKTRTPLLGTKVITTKPVKKVGTMRADEEALKKTVSERVKPLVKANFKTTRTLVKTNFAMNNAVRINPMTRKLSTTGKLASDTASIPAKSRLGGSKQVTFNKMALVNNARKQGVFSRLGI